jgi:RsiW-degrading membrane proteinase PrsW (M82 family)
MPIPVACDGCGKRFKAPDRGAGKKVPCPACQAVILIPAATVAVEEEDEYRLAEEPRPAPTTRVMPKRSADSTAAGGLRSAPSTARPPGTAPQSQGAADKESPAAARPVSAAPAWVPPTRSSTPNWLRHLHWCLALAMIPLAISIFVPERSPVDSIVEASNVPQQPDTSTSQPGDAASPASEELSQEDKARLQEVLDQMSVGDLLSALPNGKLPGALLPRDSHLHWLFAGIAAAGYLTFLVFLASDKSAQPLHLIGLGLFTGTGGILLLLFVQLAATIGTVRVRGAGGLIVLVLALIGLSYRAALDPDMGLFASFVGFCCGVGLCEEVCKALPILIYYRIGNTQTWRGAFLWGLASGTGFGVSEGIMYSQEFYNGIAGAGTYVVRFVSCVALHAIWAGSIGISINQRQDLLQEDLDEWWWYGLAVLRLIAVPMILHGLYDAFLKKDLELLALLTAVASFGYLAWQISHLRTSDDEDERAAYVTRYIRSKAASSGA